MSSARRAKLAALKHTAQTDQFAQGYKLILDDGLEPLYTAPVLQLLEGRQHAAEDGDRLLQDHVQRSGLQPCRIQQSMALQMPALVDQMPAACPPACKQHGEAEGDTVSEEAAGGNIWC